MSRPYHGHAPGDEPEWGAGAWLAALDDEAACELANNVPGLALPAADDATAADYAAVLRAAYAAGDLAVTRYIDRRYQAHLDARHDP